MRLVLPSPHMNPKHNFSNPLIGKVYHNSNYLEACSYHDRPSALSTLSTIRSHSVISDSFLQNHPIQTNQRPERVNKTTRARISAITNRRADTTIQKSAWRTVAGTFRVENAILDKHISPCEPFKFNQIAIKHIDKVEESGLAGVKSNTLSINSAAIFEGLFKRELFGSFTDLFLNKIQQYRSSALAYNLLVGSQPQEQLEMQRVTKKSELLKRIEEYESEGNFQNIRQMIRENCFPSREKRQDILKKLITKLTLCFYEEKSLSRDAEYRIFLASGQQVADPLQIPLDSSELLLGSSVDKVEHYKHLLELDKKNSKMCFKDQLKETFKRKIVQNEQQSQDHNSYQNLASRDNKQLCFEQIQSLITEKSKSKTKKCNYRHRRFHNMVAIERRIKKLSPKKSPERVKFNLVLRKLSQFLNPTPKDTSDSHSRLFLQQFERLHKLNDRYDLSYNYRMGNDRRVLMQSLRDHYAYFSNKNTEQMKCIERVVRRLARKEESAQLTEKELVDLADRELVDLTEKEFLQLHSVIHGVSLKEKIIYLVAEYLKFDSHGQLDRGAFRERIYLAVNRSRRNADIIQKIIWDCLEHYHLIEEGKIKRQQMEILYGPIKLVYFLLLSVIFGDSLCDSLLKVLKND